MTYYINVTIAFIMHYFSPQMKMLLAPELDSEERKMTRVAIPIADNIPLKTTSYADCMTSFTVVPNNS